MIFKIIPLISPRASVNSSFPMLPDVSNSTTTLGTGRRHSAINRTAADGLASRAVGQNKNTYAQKQHQITNDQSPTGQTPFGFFIQFVVSLFGQWRNRVQRGDPSAKAGKLNLRFFKLWFRNIHLKNTKGRLEARNTFRKHYYTNLLADRTLSAPVMNPLTKSYWLHSSVQYLLTASSCSACVRLKCTLKSSPATKNKKSAAAGLATARKASWVMLLIGPGGKPSFL